LAASMAASNARSCASALGGSVLFSLSSTGNS
jgi:hypothetical protein